MNSNVLVQKIEFIKGVGPQKASLLNSEIGIYNLYDLLQYFPFRYEDRSVIEKLSNVTESSIEGVYMVQVLNKKSQENLELKTLRLR